MRVFCDLELKQTEEALIIGADYRVLNDDRLYSTVKIASLYESEQAGASKYAGLRFAIRRLIDEMPAGYDSIKFRADLSRMTEKRRFKAELDYAQEKGIEVKLLRKFYHSDAYLLLEDAEQRKSSIAEGSL
ncbi:hypothetical protein [Halalkalibacter flavus]|uniref:hypothetical protein n=1 Tax=Halalkalibacter flavus TaxID=3090668 RepID=UPI002FCA13A6